MSIPSTPCRLDFVTYERYNKGTNLKEEHGFVERFDRFEQRNAALAPLRGIALFPGIMVHFDVGREKSILALEKAMESDQRLFVVAQRKFSTEDPFLDDLYSVGTVVRVRQVVKLPDGVFRVLADG